MEMFEKAARLKIRFGAGVGQLSTEDLFDLPLQTTRANGTSLDTLAKGINKQLKESEEESFVTESSSANTILQLKLDLLKYVIAQKKAENEAREAAANKAARKAKILEILESKQEEALQSKSIDELKAELASL